jgi:hypothetical protein
MNVSSEYSAVFVPFYYQVLECKLGALVPLCFPVAELGSVVTAAWVGATLSGRYLRFSYPGYLA